MAVTDFFAFAEQISNNNYTKGKGDRYNFRVLNIRLIIRHLKNINFERIRQI